MKHIRNQPKTPSEPPPNRPPQAWPGRKGGRPKLKHGGFSMMTYQGELPANRRYIARYIQEIRDGLIKDLGGPEAMTTGQRILVDRITQGLAIVRLIEEHVKELGLLDHPEGFLHPSLSDHYLRWQTSIHKALALLGVEKRIHDEPIDLTTYIREEDARLAALEEHKEPAKGEGQAEAASDGALVEGLEKDKESGHGT